MPLTGSELEVPLYVRLTNGTIYRAGLSGLSKEAADALYLALAGGSLVGPLFLSGDGTAPLHAVTKQQLDAKGALYLQLIGGTMTGPLILNADPSSALGAATRQYVDAVNARGPAGGHLTGTYPNPTILAGVIMDSHVSASAAIAQTKVFNLVADLATKVAKSGDTLTGNLIIDAAGTASMILDRGAVSNYGQFEYRTAGSQKWTVGTRANQAETFYIFSLAAGKGAIIIDEATALATVAGDPTAPLGIATKQFTDTKVAKSGDTMTGALIVPTIGGGGNDLNLSTHVAANGKTIWGVPTPTGADWVTRKDYVDAGDALAVKKTGDTMTGPLIVTSTVEVTGGNNIRVKSVSGTQSGISFFGGGTGNVLRWWLKKNSTAESGSNAGADLQLDAYDDNAAFLFNPFIISRATGLITVKGDPTAALGVATKQIVDGKVAKTGDTMTGPLTLGGNLTMPPLGQIVMPTPGTAIGRLQTLPSVPDWLGYTLNCSFNGSGWMLDDTSKAGWFFKLDSRASSTEYAVYYIPPGANPHTNEYFVFKVDGNGTATVRSGLNATDLGANTVSAYLAPSAPSHTTRKDYVDNGDAARVWKGGDTMSGALGMGNNTIYNLGAPTAADHAVNRQYSDAGDALAVKKTGDTMSGSLLASPTDTHSLGSTSQRFSKVWATRFGNDTGQVFFDDGNGTLRLTSGYFEMPGRTVTCSGVTVTADPTAPLGVATKQYVDNNGFTRNISVISGATTLGSAKADYVYVCTAALTATLPSAVGNKNLYTIKRTGTGNVTVSPVLSQTIDGAASFVLDTQYQTLELLSDGANWIVTNQYTPRTALDSRYVTKSGNSTVSGNLTVTGTLQGATITEA